jgi:hypothetical protein
MTRVPSPPGSGTLVCSLESPASSLNGLRHRSLHEGWFSPRKFRVASTLVFIYLDGFAPSLHALIFVLCSSLILNPLITKTASKANLVDVAMSGKCEV